MHLHQEKNNNDNMTVRVDLKEWLELNIQLSYMKERVSSLEAELENIDYVT